MTRDQANGLIERLRGKIPTRSGASGPSFTAGLGEWPSYPIMLTDVLEKMKQQNKLSVFYNNVCSCWKDDCGCPSGKQVDHQAELLEFWHACGVTRSLQTILQEAEWEEAPAKDPCGEGETNYCIEVMKGPAAELFEYLESLFHDENKKHET